jgi:hypothetical protein
MPLHGLGTRLTEHVFVDELTAAILVIVIGHGGQAE